jgi:excinuclease ABC subunit A
MDKIIIRGAREHNLKNINLDIPRDKLVVITGLSGSGKSSLAFDTIYAEGQRRYVESLSSYARQFLGLMEKPDVDKIDGLSPAISIDQKSGTRNPRSTVGTVTEIYDYLRLLFARIGHPHCPNCGQEVSKQTIEQITEQIMSWSSGTKIMILAPLIKDRKGEHRYIFDEIKKAGFIRARVDGRVIDISEELKLDKNKKHSIEVVVDRTVIEENERGRINESIEIAAKLGDGVILVNKIDENKDILFSENFACEQCGISLPELAPRNFSFNSPHGACPACTGLGTRLEIDPNLIIPNPKLTLAEGAIRPWSRIPSKTTWFERVLEEVAKIHSFSINVSVEKLSKEDMDIVLYGTGDEIYTVSGGYGKVSEYNTTYEGIIPNLERRYKETDSDYIRREIEKYMIIKLCPLCEGKRLKKEVLSVTIAGQNIIEITQESIDKTLEFFKNVKLSAKELTIAGQILKEIKERLGFLLDVGLSYLTLDRTAATLSGGESQRIRLATQIGSSLMGVIYILDEPSIGLHQRDEAQLMKTLKKLRDLGNSILVVEHDEDTIREADHIIDIGPGAGEHGGKLVFQGTPEELKKSNSITGLYLAGKKKIAIPIKHRKGNGNLLEIKGAREHNLKNINIEIPLGKFVCVTGVSGSGKSTIVYDILGRALAQKFHRAHTSPGEHDEVLGTEHLDKVIKIDQSPIGRTPRSNSATYTGVFTSIRELFAMTPEAKLRGYSSGRFSFNVKGGRCEACRGEGLTKIEMYFLPDVYVTCEECKGQRYNREALEIYYKGKNIADILNMSVEKALDFFENIPAIKDKLQTLFDVGLGYIKLGQPATTLSGGEAQRIKLATELSRRATGRTLYILDEPTVGLHFEDVNNLLNVLGKLADMGNTVLVIEHNPHVIKVADWLIDLGPEGGDYGGEVVDAGPPEKIVKNKYSYTGKYLKKYLKK